MTPAPPGLAAEARMVAFFLACLLGATVSYWRTTKRGEDFALCVYDLFLANFGKQE
jgi:hypothetical protein